MPDSDETSNLERIDKLTQQISLLLEHGEKVNDFLSRIADAQLKLAEVQNRLDLQQAETTDKLNALVAVVDDLVRRSGNQPPL